MHPKIARRIAMVVQAKRKAHGPEAVNLWWAKSFGSLSDAHFRQVLDELKKLR